MAHRAFTSPTWSVIWLACWVTASVTATGCVAFSPPGHWQVDLLRGSPSQSPWFSCVLFWVCTCPLPPPCSEFTLVTFFSMSFRFHVLSWMDVPISELTWICRRIVWIHMLARPPSTREQGLSLCLPSCLSTGVRVLLHVGLAHFLLGLFLGI